MALTLIIGGARSGKSELAARLAAASGRDVLVLATMQPRDDELRARVAAHRASRPAAWRTVEEPLRVLDALRAQAPAGSFVLLDCLTLWISNLLLAAAPAQEDLPHDIAAHAIAEIDARAAALASWCAAYDGDVAAVTNEVGMGVVPAYALGRYFRDALGAANRAFAARAERVYLTVAGLALDLKALGAEPVDAIADAPRR
jgi:adenosylcobinamide kinase/adenosylcobinamide-phosphate guanylyltransferase